MLHAVHRYPDARRFFGINCGFLGFLMNDMAGEPDDVVAEVIAHIAADRLLEQDFPCLQVTGAGEEGFALNDVYLERQTGQTCHLRLVVNGIEIVSRMVCDGIIAATPLGSTAYSLSAGGPACHPLVNAIQVTAICPHTPRLAPLLLPPDARIEVEVLDAERRPARVVTDGVELGPAQRLSIRYAQRTARLCFLPGHDFTTTLVRKILHP